MYAITFVPDDQGLTHAFFGGLVAATLVYEFAKLRRPWLMEAVLFGCMVLGFVGFFLGGAWGGVLLAGIFSGTVVLVSRRLAPREPTAQQTIQRLAEYGQEHRAGQGTAAATWPGPATSPDAILRHESNDRTGPGSRRPAPERRTPDEG